MSLKVEIFLFLVLSVQGDVVRDVVVAESYDTVGECMYQELVFNAMYADSENKFLASCVFIPRAKSEEDGAIGLDVAEVQKK